MINGDILVMSDQKLVRVYHDQNRRVNPKLQNYYNFLPKLKETIKGRQDEFMLQNLLRNCPKHSRLLMQFNYPVSYDPKKFLVTPYITDNFMTLNSKCSKTLRSWFDTGYRGKDPIL